MLHKVLFKVVVLCLFVCFPVYLNAQDTDFENEEELIKKAEKLFKKEEYVSAMPLFSQLTASYPNDPNYNYKYGACLLFGNEDKSEAVRFLEFSVKKDGAAPQAYFFLGEAYHLTYQFNEAIKNYELFDDKYHEKDKVDFEIERHIKQCKNANILIRNVNDLAVYETKVLPASDFFRAYNLNEFKGNLLVIPPDLQTKYDTKQEFSTVIMHHPSNQTIYFSSYGDKGTGGKDIYKRNKLPNGEWGEPINLGTKINTIYDEDFPYMHPDGKTLYFCSKGHNSIGGYDIFKSILDPNTNSWSEPKNIGFAINSPDNDYLYISDQYENAAYFASTRSNKQGEVTIYKIGAMPRKLEFAIIKGQFEIDGEENKKAKIRVTNLDSGELLGEYNSSQSGSYFMSLPGGSRVKYEVIVDGHETTSESFDIPFLKETKPLNQTITLKTHPKDYLEIKSDFSEDVNQLDHLAGAFQRNAMLQVNQKNGLEFNSGPRQINELSSIDNDNISEDNELDNDQSSEEIDISNREIVDYAYDDAKQAEEQAEELKTKSDVAFMLASQKSDQAKHLAKEIDDLMKKSSTESDPDKQVEITQMINTKQAELEEIGKEVVMTYEIAKSIEKHYQSKKKEAEFSKQYADDLNKAITSPSAEQAIVLLEEKKKELVEISKNSKSEFSLEEFQEEQRNELNQLTQKEADLNEELLAIQEEKELINKQANETKNIEIKAQLLTQVSDLDYELEEIKERQTIVSAEKNQTQEKLSILEKDNEFLSLIDNSENNILSINEINQINDAKSNLDNEVKLYEKVGQSDEVVKELANKVDDDIIASSDNSNPSLDEINETIDKIESEESKSPTEQKDEVLASLNRQKRLVENRNVEIILLEGAFNDETDPAKKESIYHQIKDLMVENKEDENKANELRTQYNQIVKDNSIEDAEEAPYVFAARSEVVKENEAGELISYENSSQELTSNENELNSNNESINDNYINDESETSNTIGDEIVSTESQNETIDDSNEISITDNSDSNINDQNNEFAINNFSNESELTDEVYQGESNSSADNVNNDSSVNNVESDNNNELAESNDNADSELVSNETSIDEEDLENKDFNDLNEEQKYARLVQTFNTDSTSSEEIKFGLDKAFGIVSNPDFEYGPNMVVQANVKNARRIEKQALSLHLQGEMKRLESENSNKGSEAKKLIKEAQKLEEEALEKQLEASQNYLIANREEYLFNKEEIETAIQSGEISNANKANEITRKAEILYNEAQQLRNNLSSTLLFEKKVEYINNAYQKELEAIELQQSLINDILKQRNDITLIDNMSSSRTDQSTDELNPTDNSNETRNSEVVAENLNVEESNTNENTALNEVNNNANVDNNSIAQNNDEVELIAENEDLALTDNEDKEINNDSNIDNNSSITNESITQNENLTETVQEAISEMTLANSQNNSEEEVFDQALKLRNMAAQSKSKEEQEALVERAKLLEEGAMKKKLNKAIASYDARQNESFENLSVLNRVKVSDNDVDELLMADMFVNESDYYKNKASESKNEAQMYDDYNNQIAQYKEAEKQQLKSLAKQKEALLLYAKNNPNISEEDKMFIENLPNYDNSEIRNTPVVNDENEELASSNSNQNQYNEDSNEGSNSDENNDEDLALNNETSLTETNNDESIDNQNDNSNNSVNDITNANNTGVSDNNESPNEIEIPTEYIDEYTTYYSAIKESESKLNEAESDLDKSIQLRTEANELNNRSDDKLRAAEVAQTEEEIESLIAEADQLRIQADNKNKLADDLQRSADSNVSEAKSKKTEAELYLADLDPDITKVIQQASEAEGGNVDFTSYDSKRNSTSNNTLASNNTNESNNDISPINITQPNLTGSGALTKEGIQFGQPVTYSKENPIPLDPIMPEGLVFKVQVGAFRNEIPQDLFKGIAPLMGEKTSMGFIRYTAGMFKGFESANMAKNEVRGMGYYDAFVVAFYNGKRISLSEARRMIDNSSDPEKAAYNELVATEVEEFKRAGVGQNYTDKTTDQIANDIKNVKGLMYTVQVGFYSKYVGADKLYNLNPLYTENTGSGYRYMHGMYNDFNSADKRKSQVRNIGVGDAFVIAYRDGQKVSVEEANRMLDDEGKRILANRQDQNINDNTSANLNSGSDGSSSSGAAGVAFKVQIGAYRDQVPLETAALFIQLAENGVDYFENESGLTIYAVGEFNTPEDAQGLKNIAISLGVSDAFITAYKDGSRITMNEALALLGR